jgi:hypothetical protein
MGDSLTQLGVGGIFVIVVLREVFSFINRNGKKKLDESAQSVTAPFITKQDFERLKLSVQYKDNCGEIVKRIDQRFDAVDTAITEVKTLIRKSG